MTRKVEQRRCALCNTLFTPSPRAPHQKFCSRECRNKTWGDTHRGPGMDRTPMWARKEPDGEQTSSKTS